MSVHIEQMTTLEKKIQHFSRILSQRPGDELTILALAEAAFRRGLKLEALTAYQDLAGGRPVPEAHLAVAEIYSAQGMPHEAYGELRRLFELDPDNVEARLLVNALQEDALPPEDVRQTMQRPTTDEAFEEARLRLKIQRAIYNRELQERTRNVTLEPGTVIHEYHMEEAKKKLIRVDELLRELERFREFNQSLVEAQEQELMPRPEPVSAQADGDSEAEGEPAEVSALELELPVGEAVEGEPAPVLDELPVELVEADSPQAVAESPSLEGESAVATLEGEPPLDSAPEIEVGADDDGVEPEADPTEGAETAPEIGEPSLSGELIGENVGEDVPVELVESALEAPADEAEPSSALDLAPMPMAQLEPVPTTAHFPAPEFDIGMDSLEPDLPDLGPEPELETVASTEPTDDPEPVADPEVEPLGLEPALSNGTEMVDLEPIDMGGVGGPPTFDDAPVLPEPVAADPPVLMPMMEDDSTMILVGGEAEPVSPVAETVVEPVVEPSFDAIEPSIEPTFASAEAELPQEVSAARKAFYEMHHESLSGLTTTLARTRGVTSIFLVAREGQTIDSVAKDDISEKRVGDLVRESFEFLEAFANDPAYWVLECAGGIFVMQKLDERHVLIAIGQAGANFGALRYTMDKTRTKFEQILAQAPA